jgi:hypothetical protein
MLFGKTGAEMVRLVTVPSVSRIVAQHRVSPTWIQHGRRPSHLP